MGLSLQNQIFMCEILPYSMVEYSPTLSMVSLHSAMIENILVKVKKKTGAPGRTYPYLSVFLSIKRLE